MNGSNNLLLRAALVLVLLGAAITARPFTFALNDRTGLPIKWPAGQVQLRVMMGEAPVLSDGTTFNSSVREAALTWNALLGSCQFQMTFSDAAFPGDNNEINELSFVSKVYGRDFDPGTLAITTGYSVGNERVEADIIFNNAYKWDSYRGNQRPGLVDLRRVALHELGHVLGLDHPDEHGQTVDAIMNSTIGNRDSLSPDDIQGGQSLYGPPGAPANDNFANATLLSLNGSSTLSVKGYNTNASKESGEPSHATNGVGAAANTGGRSVWWRWTAPSGGSVTIDTRGSYFDSLLGVYTGTVLTSLTRIASNDDIDPGIVQASTVTFTATGGTEYRIAVDGFNNEDGLGADNAGITLNLAFSGSLGTAPAITTQPASVSVDSGASATFSVAASGTAPLAYQWSFNGTAINGATNSSYTVAASSSTAGTYQVTVSNQAGSVTSSNATLTVNTPPPPPPPSSGGGGGGGGGAPSLWFCAVLALLSLTRYLRPGNLRPET